MQFKQDDSRQHLVLSSTRECYVLIDVKCMQTTPIQTAIIQEKKKRLSHRRNVKFRKCFVYSTLKRLLIVFTVFPNLSSRLCEHTAR